jgi:hypothetical protein
MIRKKDLLKRINEMEDRMRKIERNQAIGIGEEFQVAYSPAMTWYLQYETPKDVLMALLKHLNLEIVEPEIKPVEKPKKFEIVPISKKQKVKEGGDSKPVNNVDDLLETDGVITVSVTGTQSARKSTFIEKILQTEFGGYTVVEANDHFIRYANLRAWMPTGKKPKRGE